jgi:predicted acylesterase/phospholipase RssA
MKALVLSGGGSHAAYQVGVLKYLLGDLKTQYDIICGISAGGINAAYLAQFGKGQEQESIRRLEELWLEIDNSKIWKHRLIKYLPALWKSSVLCTSPLQNMIRNNVRMSEIKKAGKKLRIGAVSLTTGDYYVATEQYDNLADIVIASSAFPGFFETIKINNEIFTDGGVRNMAPLSDAIKAGATDIDIVFASDPHPKIMHNNFTCIEVLVRSLSLLMGESFENDIKMCQLKNQISGYKNIRLKVYRNGEVFENLSLDFSPDKIREHIEIGYNDGRRAQWI